MPQVRSNPVPVNLNSGKCQKAQREHMLFFLLFLKIAWIVDWGFIDIMKFTIRAITCIYTLKYACSSFQDQPRENTVTSHKHKLRRWSDAKPQITIHIISCSSFLPPPFPFLVEYHMDKS